jgi:hypothetical protein
MADTDAEANRIDGPLLAYYFLTVRQFGRRLKRELVRIKGVIKLVGL